MLEFNEITGRRKITPTFVMKNRLAHLLLVSWKPPSRRRILANSTAFRNGTSIISSRLRSTSNLYFFFFIINAMPGALGPSNVINKFKMKPLWVGGVMSSRLGTFTFFLNKLFPDFCFGSVAGEPRISKNLKFKLLLCLRRKLFPLKFLSYFTAFSLCFFHLQLASGHSLAVNRKNNE